MFLVTLVHGLQGDLLCCEKQIVNGITYILDKKSNITAKPECLNSCIYYKEEYPYPPYYCFKAGIYPPKCVKECQGI